ncbi:MAG: hypothetical protein E2O84_00585 [Bacteroidetes bacterium]|nr:MAG: hypothetical protein E2O84_00585 [Bacteroidota bacterium]
MTEISERAAQISVFASIGSLTVTQELSGRIKQAYPEFDDEVVAEETLCFVAAVAAFCIRSTSEGKVTSGSAAAVSDLPFSYRDYVLGQLILGPDSTVSDELSGHIGERLTRKTRFYDSQLVNGLRPTTEKGLENLSILWMGRISTPGQKDSPENRIKQLHVVELMLRHMTLISSFTTHATS